MPVHPLLAKSRKSGNPIIENELVTFVWKGKTAPHLIDDLHNWEEDPKPMHRIGSSLWSISISLLMNSYFEYAFIDLNTNERLPDPLNPNKIWNGINAYNYYFYMPEGRPTPLVKLRRNTSKGLVTRHKIPTKEYIIGSNRSVYLYQPCVKFPVPLLVVYDGFDYLKRARLSVMVDNMIAAKTVRPFAMAMIQNGGQARVLEYSCSESTLAFLYECVIPYAQQHLNLIAPEKEPYGVLGASMGGLMALYTGIRMPQIFGKVISQSGPFILPEHEFVVVDLVRYTPPPKIKIWMDAGRYEWLLESNRGMYDLLKGKRYRVTYNEYSGGHNFTSWRNDVWKGLEVLFSNY
jgi:enterochelin esterase-like enzyme